MNKQISKWADSSQYHAERIVASDGVTATLISANNDPLGEIFSIVQMYRGVTVTDLSTITDAQREEVLADIQKTVLKMPLEAVRFHFVIEGLHRGVTHQMVRQRTAAYAQESMRFAVKDNLAEAVVLPPSLRGTKSFDELVKQDLLDRAAQGLEVPTDATTEDGQPDEWHHEHAQSVFDEALANGGPQAWRLKWDTAVNTVSDIYGELVEDGMAAEDARGLTPTNTATKIHYITNLRSLLETLSMRVSDQAQFEWREVAMALVKAMRDYGRRHTYHNQTTGEHLWPSSEWQFTEISRAIKPIDFVLGRRGFGSDVDRPSRIAERVEAYALCGVPSDQWLAGSVAHGIPPIHPDEWLLDPESARLKAGEEFDVFGNRVPEGTGWHWQPETKTLLKHADGRVSEMAWGQDRF